MDTTKLITASEAARRFGVPLWAIYRMAERKQITPVELKREAWQKRPQRRFDPAEVARALGR